MNTIEKLAPCPFCGSTGAQFERIGTPRQSCIVACNNCGARHESSDEGLACGSSWNDRAQQAGGVPARFRDLVEMCRKALAEELSAWDIDPPLHHVKEAHDACEAWLAAAPSPSAVQPLSEAQIDDEFLYGTSRTKIPMAAFMQGVRFAERHYGIVTPKDSQGSASR